MRKDSSFGVFTLRGYNAAIARKLAFCFAKDPACRLVILEQHDDDRQRCSSIHKSDHCEKTVKNR